MNLENHYKLLVWNYRLNKICNQSLISLVSYKRDRGSKEISYKEIFKVVWDSVRMTPKSPVLFLENHYKLYKNGYKIKFKCLDSLMSIVSNEIKYNTF